MFKSLRTLFRQLVNDTSCGDAVDTPTLHLAMASLLCEVASADHEQDPREEIAKQHLLMKLLDINEVAASDLLTKAQQQSDASVSLYDFTNKLRSLEQSERYQLIEAMWKVAYADGVIDPQEEAVIRQVSELIYLDHSAFIKAKITAKDAMI
ncbi:TerB family tellurite resistance protein [Photobacterium lucens]|uniref:tellurite resistance TerB family protein n=1 Tax=Photobacterium lucens TaxID=2562949 RepID=UPI001370274D|nr:TerB family tellurite resistance protein [Photobacterium lucens]MBP2698601.1 TerB family tellurite resistance protein [Vibrio parahaemolyticus]MZG56402.1 TerB family tellurite resistance protein [Photobacterium lucens]MZG79314.1 TerB family tellurite resistance protein [Photobacterium lucens]